MSLAAPSRRRTPTPSWRRAGRLRVVGILFGALLMAAVALARPAHAEEAPADEPAARHAAIGRDLLAVDPAVRERAERALLAALGKSQSPARVLREVLGSTRAWADASERLIERWIHESVTGDLATRRRAVRLIHAAGPEAVLRLATALRHRVMGAAEESASADDATTAPATGGVTAPGALNDAPPPDDGNAPTPSPAAGSDLAAPSGTGPSESAPPAQQTTWAQGVTPQFMQLYDVSRLRDNAVGSLELRTFLLDNSQGSNVKLIGAKALVFADADGHQRLRKVLLDWKAPASKDKNDKDAEKEAPPATSSEAAPAMPAPGAARLAPKPPAAEAPAPREASADAAQQTDTAAPAKNNPPGHAIVPPPPAANAQKPASEAPPTAAPVAGPRWRIDALIVRVPKRENGGVVEPQRRWVGRSNKASVNAPLFPKARADGVGVHTRIGTLQDAMEWSKLAEVLPDAETHRPGALTVGLRREGRQFIGNRRSYRRDVQRQKGGGYAVIEGEILEGLHLGFRVHASESGKIELETQARRIEAKGPWQTHEKSVEGTKQKVELDLPEQNVARGAARSKLPLAGGGVAILFRDLEREQKHYVVLVLTVKQLQK